MIYQTVINTINEYRMLDGVKSVLLGFSGGADSTALLQIMRSIPDIEVFAVHVNHNIRGEEALRDQLFCEDFCRRHNIKLFIENVDVPKLAKSHCLSIEETARNERYRIFDSLCSTHDINRIVTAHNSDDNIETVIFNMSRGTSLRGLCGIPPIRDNIIRPLIECSKADIINYCYENNLEFMIDSTNLNNDYTRNFIRNEIVPKFKILNPSVDIAITRMCKSLRTDDNYFKTEVAKLPDNLTVNQLKNLHDSILSRYLVRQYESACPNGYLGGDHIMAIIDMVRNGYPNNISLPCKMNFKLYGDNTGFVKEVNYQKFTIPKTYLKMGENPVTGTNSVIFLTDNEKDIKLMKNIYKLFIYKEFKFDTIVGCIYIRSRQNGDKYTFGNMTRNVKKLLCDRHIPQNERDLLPFVCDDKGILWVPHFDIRDDVKVLNNKEKKVFIAYYVI